MSFQFYCVVTTHFTLDSNLNSSIHCSISKSTFQVSKAKLLLQKSVLRCSKVLSGSDSKKVASNRPIRMQYFLPEYIKLQSELVQRSTFFWLVYLQTSRHATQMNWINTKVKCIVHICMGLSKVKILRKPVVSEWPIRMLYSGKQKRFFIFIFCITKFKHMFVHSAWNHGAKLVLTFLPYRLWTCHLSREK